MQRWQQKPVMNWWTVNSSVQDCQKRKKKRKKNYGETEVVSAPTNCSLLWGALCTPTRATQPGKGFCACGKTSTGWLLRCRSTQCTAVADRLHRRLVGGRGTAFDSDTPFTHPAGTPTPPPKKKHAASGLPPGKPSTQRKELNALFCVFTKVNTA